MKILEVDSPRTAILAKVIKALDVLKQPENRTKSIDKDDVLTDIKTVLGDPKKVFYEPMDKAIATGNIDTMISTYIRVTKPAIKALIAHRKVDTTTGKQFNYRDYVKRLVAYYIINKYWPKRDRKSGMSLIVYRPDHFFELTRKFAEFKHLSQPVKYKKIPVNQDTLDQVTKANAPKPEAKPEE